MFDGGMDLDWANRRLEFMRADRKNYTLMICVWFCFLITIAFGYIYAYGSHWPLVPAVLFSICLILIIFYGYFSFTWIKGEERWLEKYIKEYPASAYEYLGLSIPKHG